VINQAHRAFRQANRDRDKTARLGRTVPLSAGQPELDETWALLRALPERQRMALVLRFYEDLSEAEIARLLGCRPGTVKSLIHRGLAKVRKDIIR
jgi:DNA-directed RNA polymerase specialized sigma24 family protein